MTAAHAIAARPLSVLVFGHSGQVATELRRLAGPELSVRTLSRAEADLANPEACARAAAESDADVVINAAAYTNVDRAETEEELATVINGAAPGAIAAIAAARGAVFLHLSTDFVFDGRAGVPLPEDAPVAPLGAYGRSKLAGERATLDAYPDAVVIRTTRVFAAHGANFVRTMLRAAKTNPALRVVDDQLSGPTAADEIARTLLTIARARLRGEGEPGIFHYCAAPTVSMIDFTREIFRQAPWSPMPALTAIKSAEWPTLAERPLAPLMDCARIRAVYGIEQPDWRISLSRVLAELKETDA